MAVSDVPRRPPPPHPLVILLLVLILAGVIYTIYELNALKNIEQVNTTSIQQTR
jgi:hypothetical protein